MKPKLKPDTIEVAEDDPDNRKLTSEAFDESKLVNDLRFVEDGVVVFDYLNRRGKFLDVTKSPWPSLLLIDLNMSCKDGREVLRELQANPRFQRIRVIVMTTSKSEEDIVSSYAFCATSFMTKPMKFESLVEVVKTLGRYWLEIVEFPDNGTPNAS